MSASFCFEPALVALPTCNYVLSMARRYLYGLLTFRQALSPYQKENYGNHAKIRQEESRAHPNRYSACIAGYNTYQLSHSMFCRLETPPCHVWLWLLCVGIHMKMCAQYRAHRRALVSYFRNRKDIAIRAYIAPVSATHEALIAGHSATQFCQSAVSCVILYSNGGLRG